MANPKFLKRCESLTEIELHIVLGTANLLPGKSFSDLSKADQAFLNHFDNLAQDEIASLLGVTPSCVCQWEDCPRNLDGTYRYREVMWYRVAKAAGFTLQK